MNSFTKGPWKITPLFPGDKKILLEGPKVYVDYDDVDHEEQEANARLIAQAPVMYKLLKSISATWGGAHIEAIYPILKLVEGK